MKKLFIDFWNFSWVRPAVKNYCDLQRKYFLTIAWSIYIPRAATGKAVSREFQEFFLAASTTGLHSVENILIRVIILESKGDINRGYFANTSMIFPS